MHTRLESKTADLGEFTVRRTLPSPIKRSVGPFVFFDHMGPATFPPGKGVAVRPHPHIGLATVTYLFEGEIMHRDSLGYEQPIQPGAVNWMVAGQGIVHSERTRKELVKSGSALHGIQSWLALPKEFEECEPSFAHHPESTLPEVKGDHYTMRLIAGEAMGMKSSVETFSRMFYLDVGATAGSQPPVPEDHMERALYLVSGSISVDGDNVEPGVMVILDENSRPRLKIHEDARYMLLGGDPLDGSRKIWWNFVSSRPDRIEQAKADWKEGRFASVPGDDEFIPLPE